MYKARGIMLRLGDDDNFLFHNRTRIDGLGSKWGVSLSIRWGMAYFPLGKNAMHNYQGQRVYKFPVIAPWVSVMLGKYGFYVGMKMFHWHPDYEDWVRASDIHKWDDGDKLEATCLHPSGRMTNSWGK